jgi:DNA-binding MarR family transcriptional regulator
VASADLLSTTEEAFWRALMRIVLALPRRLDNDLAQAAGITANEYLTLMSLSEAPEGELRMTDLARATALSPSRITRLIDDLRACGLVTKRASAKDGRGNVATLTPAGLAKLTAAWRVHVASARALVFDHVDPASTSDAAQTLSEIAERLEGRL